MSYNYTVNPTQNLSSLYTTTANIVSFDINTNIAVLDAPVDISLGYNQAIGSVTSQYNIIGNELNVLQAIQNGALKRARLKRVAQKAASQGAKVKFPHTLPY